MDLPEEKGRWILIAVVRQRKRLAIDRLGSFDLVPGFCACMGSACGPGGMRARISHHWESVATPHWHIDCLDGLDFRCHREVRRVMALATT